MYEYTYITIHSSRLKLFSNVCRFWLGLQTTTGHVNIWLDKKKLYSLVTLIFYPLDNDWLFVLDIVLKRDVLKYNIEFWIFLNKRLQVYWSSIKSMKPEVRWPSDSNYSAWHIPGAGQIKPTVH